MEESTKYGLLTFVVLSLLGIGLFAFRKQILNSKSKSFLDGITSEEVEILTMKEIITYFKGQNLNPKKHVPFLANSSGQFKEIEKEDFFAIIAGVFNEASDEFSPTKVYYTKKISEDIKAIMGNEELIVLN